jgi:hypothetical protein
MYKVNVTSGGNKLQSEFVRRTYFSRFGRIESIRRSQNFVGTEFSRFLPHTMFNTTNAFTVLRSTKLSENLLDFSPSEPYIPIFFTRLSTIVKNKSQGAVFHYVFKLSQNSFTISTTSEAIYNTYKEFHVDPALFKILIERIQPIVYTDSITPDTFKSS